MKERRFHPGNEHEQLKNHEGDSERPHVVRWPGKRTLISQRPFNPMLAGMRSVRAVVSDRRLDGEPLTGIETLAYAQRLGLGRRRATQPDREPQSPSLLDDRVRDHAPSQHTPGTGVTALRDQALRGEFTPAPGPASPGWSESLRGVMSAIGEGVPLQSWAGITATVANAIATLGTRAEATRLGADLTALIGEVGELFNLVAAAQRATDPEERRVLEARLRDAADRYGGRLAEISMRASTMAVSAEPGVPGDQIADQLYAAIDQRLPVLRSADRRDERVRVTVRDEAMRALVTGEISRWLTSSPSTPRTSTSAWTSSRRLDSRARVSAACRRTAPSSSIPTCSPRMQRRASTSSRTR